jgi:hypothetical protein
MHPINISRTTVQHMRNWKGIQILTIWLISKGLLFFYTPCRMNTINSLPCHIATQTSILWLLAIVYNKLLINSCNHIISILLYRTLNIRSKYKCLHVYHQKEIKPSLPELFKIYLSIICIWMIVIVKIQHTCNWNLKVSIILHCI